MVLFQKTIYPFFFAIVAAVAFLFSGLGGSLSEQEVKRDAIKTGNAYYKQIVDENGNVKNEFHWAKEPKENIECNCPKRIKTN